MQIYADYSKQLDPNCYTADRGGHPVLLLVCHNTAGPNDNNSPTLPKEQAQSLSDTAAKYLVSNDRQVSIHWVVGAEAAGAPIYKVVPEQYTAYHCGGTPPDFISKWVNPDDSKTYGGYNLNQVAIGIEVFGQVSDNLGSNQLNALKELVLDIFSRYPILREKGHIVAHKELEGDREDGMDWVKDAVEWVSGLDPNLPTPVIEPISYRITVPQYEATVRKGPGRTYDIITTLKPDNDKQYQVDGEAHGDNINGDDVWSHINDGDTKGFVTRTAVNILH